MDKIARAQELLRDEVLMEVFASVEGGYTKLILNSAEDDVDGRERAFHRIRALQDVKGALEALAATAEIKKKRIPFF